MAAITDAPTTDDPTADAPRAGKLTLHLERRLRAPRALVFQAWTDPAHLRRWSAPHGFSIPECDGDLRPGGTWHSTLVSPAGERLRLRGTYREVSPPERLVLTHCWLGEDGRPGPETVITVELEEIPEGTLLRFTQSGFESEADRNGHDGGWSQCFERLEALLDRADSRSRGD